MLANHFVWRTEVGLTISSMRFPTPPYFAFTNLTGSGSCHPERGEGSFFVSIGVLIECCIWLKSHPYINPRFARRIGSTVFIQEPSFHGASNLALREKIFHRNLRNVRTGYPHPRFADPPQKGGLNKREQGTGTRQQGTVI